MKKTFHITCIISLIFLSFSCKKKEQEVPIDPATGCTNCTPSYASTFVGFFKATTYTLSAPLSTSTVSSRASAYFSNTAVSVPSAASATSVTNVFFNSDTLKDTGAPFYYTNYLPVNFTTKTWSVTGAGPIPSFTFNDLKEKPGYTSMSVLPDTVRKSVGFAIVLNGVQNITGASAYISDGYLIPSVFSKVVKTGDDTLNFTIENLSSLSTSTNAVITVFMENAFAVKVDTKDFKMSNESTYSKRVVIKN